MPSLVLEALPRNDLNKPAYATEYSAGIDFAACLKRPCKLILPEEKIEFFATNAGTRSLVEDLNAQPAVGEKLKLTIEHNETIMVSLGYKCQFDKYCVMQLHIRSSVGLSGLLLANNTGIIDSDFRGELFACLYNRYNWPVTIEHGQRIVQGILMPFYKAEITYTAVDKTVRGEGGFGSTGSH